MHQRKAERVRHMFSPQREVERAVLREPQTLGALEQPDDHRRHALGRRELAEGGQVVIDHALLARAEPGELIGKLRHILEYRHTRLRGNTHSSMSVSASTL